MPPPIRLDVDLVLVGWGCATIGLLVLEHRPLVIHVVVVGQGRIGMHRAHVRAAIPSRAPCWVLEPQALKPPE